MRRRRRRRRRRILLLYGSVKLRRLDF